jgi:hypothetical protein
MKLILAYMVCHLVYIFCPFDLPFCCLQTLKGFINEAKSQVDSVTRLYSDVVIFLTIFFSRLSTAIKGYKIILFVYRQGRNADALAQYFGEDPARCPFEQGRFIIIDLFIYIFI